MVLVRFLIQLLAFIGVLASVSFVVLVVTLMLRFPLVSIAVGIACALFYGVLKRLPKIGGSD